jgi:hypothetical protein
MHSTAVEEGVPTKEKSSHSVSPVVASRNIGIV